MTNPEEVLAHYRNMWEREVLNENPGPKLDALVAEKVKGHKICWNSFGDPYISDGFCGVRAQRYSTSISAAWEAWEHDRPNDWIIELRWSDGKYTATIKTVTEDGLKYVAKIEAENAPEAIVKCRLLAVGG